MRNILNRIERLEDISPQAAQEEEVIHIGGEFTDKDSLVKAKVNNQEFFRNNDETWEQFEKRVNSIAGGNDWAYYYKENKETFSLMILLFDYPRFKRSRGQYAY